MAVLLEKLKSKWPMSIDQRTALFLWIALLSSIVLVSAVIANFNIGNRQFKIEMAQHWPDYQPDAQAPSSGGPTGGLSAATLELAYNKLARSLNDVSISLSGSRLVNGITDQVHGSGVLVADGYALTNFHVVENASDLHITVYAPAETSYPARVVLTDQANDLALVMVQTNKILPSATLGNSDTADVGDMVFSMGNAMGSGNMFTTGVICGRSQTFYVDGREYRNMIRMETYIYPGSSGGPLANIKGEIIGINTAIYDPQGKFTGISFAMPINRAMALLKTGNITGYGATAPMQAIPAAFTLAA